MNTIIKLYAGHSPIHHGYIYKYIYIYVTYINPWWINEWLIFPVVLSGNWSQNMWKNYVTLSEAALKSAIAIPWELPEILLFSKIPWVLGKFREISLLFHGKAISLSFVECVGTLANSGGRYSICISDFRCTVASSPAIYGITVRSRWPARIRKWQLCFVQWHIYHPILQHLLSQTNK